MSKEMAESCYFRKWMGRVLAMWVGCYTGRWIRRGWGWQGEMPDHGRASQSYRPETGLVVKLRVSKQMENMRTMIQPHT
jgi:hypothetical protein